MTGLPCFDLSGKVAVVTGGASGIGRGIADGLAEAGADVVIGSRRLDQCAEACQTIREHTGVRTLALRCDLTDQTSIGNFVSEIIAKLGHIDILVNNAGTIVEKPILEMQESDWDLMLDTNLKGIFTLTKAVAKNMIGRGKGGKIINVASTAGVIAWPKMSAYCASKGGCIQLTRVMALEWAKHDIQANAIVPGYFLTPISENFVNSEKGREVIARDIPLKRVARPEEIKGLANLLASQGASFITGAAFTIDGGQTCR
jgi:NAD(P)-dependent dehydrogenase (short-subunit alcohol dehydrogenase family)